MIEKYPKISIVTPSYNQAKYLEKTILSVISQDYPNLEYIIMDGGSTDGSLEIIKKYEKFITYWESKKDNGQADAIYRGFLKTTGNIIGWINSDDYFLKGALLTVGKTFMDNPDVIWATGHGIIVDEKGVLIKKFWNSFISLHSMMAIGCGIFQPSTFWKRDIFFSVDGFDMSLNYSFDYDLFLKLSKLQKPKRMNAFLSAFRIHSDSKTGISNSNEEVRKRNENETQSLYMKNCQNRLLLVKKLKRLFYSMVYIITKLIVKIRYFWFNRHF
jgi:glycosyltransferase involved in cell wall biosynthesis